MLKGLKKWIPLFWPALAGALLSIGLVLPVLRATGLEATRQAVSASLLTGLVCAATKLAKGRRTKWLVSVIVAAFILLYLAASGMLLRIGGMLSASVHLLQGNGEPLRVYAAEIAWLAGAVLTLIGCGMARQSAGFFPVLSMTMVAVLIVWFSGDRDGLWLFLPAFFVLCVLFAHAAGEETPPPRALVVSFAVVVLALMLTPAFQVQSSGMESFAASLRNYITDTFFFTEPRTVYTIQSDGYKPLETRLGGPVDVKERPVMTVKTPRAMLLRGTVYNEYNGLAWGDTLSTRRYLYSDFRNRALRADTMDEKRPNDAVRDPGSFELLDVEVTMRADSASTLFVPLRAEQLSMPMSMVPYFNTASEIFITRDLTAEDSYSIRAPVVALDDPRLAGQVILAAQQGEHRDMSDYLRVPEAIADEVRELALRLTEDAGTPLEKAIAIQTHLRRNYAYTLTPDVPPGNQDFVSYFLLREKKGYCTYFASAMAVLGRLAGLPTRYVEGYLAEPSGGTALVTSKNAHAWAEVYFDGFGWISFDATPPHGTGGQNNSDTQDDPQEGQQNQTEQTPQEEGDTPPVGSEEEQGGGEPEADDDENPEATPTPSPDPASASTPAPTPTPTPTPTPPPDAPEDQPPDAQDQEPSVDEPPPEKPKRFLAVLLVLLLLLAAIAREYFTRLDTVVARKCKSDDERLMAWYRGLLGILAQSGIAALPSESPYQLLLRAGKVFPEACGLSALAETMTQSGYGRESAAAEAAAQARECYRKTFRAAKLLAKGKWFVRRVVFGIGSVKQVP